MKTKEEVENWIKTPTRWPTADSYDPKTLEPLGDQLPKREKCLQLLLPKWFWKGENKASIISFGAGKGYFERKYWSGFNRIYIVDPLEWTESSLVHFPIRNAVLRGKNVFTTSFYLDPPAKYGWLGTSIHYMFEECCGWEFMWKIGMMVKDTVIIDGGIFDPDSIDGKRFMEKWKDAPQHPMNRRRREKFSYEEFLKTIEGIWSVEMNIPCPWIPGRRNLILKRKLREPVYLKDLGKVDVVKKNEAENKVVYRTVYGDYLKTQAYPWFLIADVIEKVMKWPLNVRGVYNEERFFGVLMADMGQQMPSNVEESIHLFLDLMRKFMPLGIFPADVARQNVRIVNGVPVLIDIGITDLYGPEIILYGFDNLYKQYKNPISI